MPFSNRSILAVLYSSLIFGTIATPYVYIASGALSYFHVTAIVILVSWLVACTAVLLLAFVTRSRLERDISKRLGRCFRPVAGAAVVAAMASSVFIESRIANFTLLAPIEYWYDLILITSITTACVFAVIVFTRPSRLEKVIASKLSRGNKSFLLYRTVGYIALTIGLFFVCTSLYDYYLYKRPPSP